MTLGDIYNERKKEALRRHESSSMAKHIDLWNRLDYFVYGGMAK